MLQPALLSQSPPPRRGVYKLKGSFLGRNAYFALTADLRFVGDVIHLTAETEDDAQLVRRLRIALNEADRPRLVLLPRSVLPAIDGPSPSHPTLKLEEPDPLDASATELAAHDPLTNAVYRSLYEAIYGPGRA